jgi:hypothetical protein
MSKTGIALDPNCGLAELRASRHRSGRDLKVVITQRDSETGGGKTTLAVFLALSWDRSWDGEEQGTVSANEFLSTYPQLPQHSCLIMDEAEELDARRSQKRENVEFSKDWMMMRTRQIDSILTLPTTSALDKRLLELADVRINVTRRGKGRVYRIKVDDHQTHRGPTQWFMHEIEWPDLSQNKEFLKLDKQKQDKIEQRGKEARQDDEEEEEEQDGLTKKEQKALAQALRDTGMTMREIAKNPNIEYTYGWVRDHTVSQDEAQTV